MSKQLAHNSNCEEGLTSDPDEPLASFRMYGMCNTHQYGQLGMVEGWFIFARNSVLCAPFVEAVANTNVPPVSYGIRLPAGVISVILGKANKEGLACTKQA